MDGLEAGVGIVLIPIPGLIFRPNPGNGIDFRKPGSWPGSRFFYEIIFMKVVFSKIRLITRQIPGSKTGRDRGPSRSRPPVGGWSSHYCSETWNSETLENEVERTVYCLDSSTGAKLKVLNCLIINVMLRLLRFQFNKMCEI